MGKNLKEFGKSLRFFGESVGVKVPKKRTLNVFGERISQKRRKAKRRKIIIKPKKVEEKKTPVDFGGGF